MKTDCIHFARIFFRGSIAVGYDRRTLFIPYANPSAVITYNAFFLFCREILRLLLRAQSNRDDRTFVALDFSCFRRATVDRSRSVMYESAGHAVFTQHTSARGNTRNVRVSCSRQIAVRFNESTHVEHPNTFVFRIFLSLYCSAFAFPSTYNGEEHTL